MNSNQRSFVAGEDLGPSLWAKISGLHIVSLAGVDSAPYGVTHEGTREAPIPGVTPLHAAAGESATIYGPGDNCEILSGEAITAGDFLRPDATNRAVVCSEGENYYAQAVSTVSGAGQLVKITLIRGVTPGSTVDTVAAAGTNQATGALLAIGLNLVTGADGTKAVVLPVAGAAGKRVRVYSTVATNGLPIFPAVGGAINGGSTNAAITIEGKTFAHLESINATDWAAIFTVNT